MPTLTGWGRKLLDGDIIASPAIFYYLFRGLAATAAPYLPPTSSDQTDVIRRANGPFVEP